MSRFLTKTFDQFEIIGIRPGKFREKNDVY